MRRAVLTAVLLVGTFLIGAWYFYPRPGSSPPTSAMICRNNLKQISLALYNYHAQHQCFPPTCVYDERGRPAHSWRVLLLPYLDVSSDDPTTVAKLQTYDFSEPWNGPHNSKLAHISLNIFACPARKNDGKPTTSYVAITGPNSPWQLANENGHSPQFELSVMVVELADSNTHWMDPSDLSAAEALRILRDEAARGVLVAHSADDIPMIHAEVPLGEPVDTGITHVTRDELDLLLLRVLDRSVPKSWDAP